MDVCAFLLLHLILAPASFNLLQQVMTFKRIAQDLAMIFVKGPDLCSGIF